MIIVSQDEDIIINFEKTQNLWIDDNILDKTDVTFDIVADETTIASYKTEERAKEVLLEISERAENWKNLEQGMPSGVCRYRYEMPKE